MINEKEKQRQLFVFWQFDGNNSSWCNQSCRYCYGGKKEMHHYWTNNILQWENAFERLNRDIYFVMSYGESMGMRGFYECVDMIGRHPTWTLCIVTNLSFSPERLLTSRLAKEKRLFLNPCWHPLGVEDRAKGWEIFKKHLLMLQEAEIPTHVLYLLYKPQIKWFPEYFEWLDSHNFRVAARRYVGNIGGLKFPVIKRKIGGKNYPGSYNEAERGYLYSSTCPKVTEYGLKLASPKGKLCSAGKDMILVKYDGTVGLCADCENKSLGNIFDPNFKLSDQCILCPGTMCGGDYGMLHLIDDRFGPLPSRLDHDTFLSQVENVPQSIPVAYPNRKEMLRWLKTLK